MAIFDAVKHIQDQDYKAMSPAQLLQLIQELSGSALPKMSPGYYLDRLQAVTLLADAALLRLDRD